MFFYLGLVVGLCTFVASLCSGLHALIVGLASFVCGVLLWLKDFPGIVQGGMLFLFMAFQTSVFFRLAHNERFGLLGVILVLFMLFPLYFFLVDVHGDLVEDGDRKQREKRMEEE